MFACLVCRRTKTPTYAGTLYTVSPTGVGRNFCSVKCGAYLARLRGGLLIMRLQIHEWVVLDTNYPRRGNKSRDKLNSTSPVWPLIPDFLKKQIEPPSEYIAERLDAWRRFHRISRLSHSNEYRMTAKTCLSQARNSKNALSPPILVDNQSRIDHNEIEPTDSEQGATSQALADGFAMLDGYASNATRWRDKDRWYNELD